MRTIKKKAAKKTSSLKKYNEKRDFKKTREPVGKSKRSPGESIFVVQRHEASHLHYDFRLELAGVLKSWAVPKEPTMDASIKRLAVEVEDHPLDYANFHGDIPKGEYGGGHVEIWDAGTWKSLDKDPQKALSNGKLSFELRGDKLAGRWSLVRTRNFRGSSRQTSWLLMKSRDGVVAGKQSASKKPRPTLSASKPEPVTLTHPDKILFASTRITKAQFAKYLKSVAKRMLPLVEHRPLSFLRCPEGRIKKCFYQQHYKSGLGANIGSVMISEESGTSAPHPIITSTEGLQALAQNGVLELHTWGSTASDLEHPDQLVFDFDPDDDVPWAKVVKSALLLKSYLEDWELTAFVKLSGGKGVHVHVPIEPEYSWRDVHAFTEHVAKELEALEPQIFTSSSSKKKRKGLIYLDYQRNSRGATFVAPYSTRAGGSIALPIFWRELTAKLKPDHFTLKNISKRLKAVKSDPWKEFKNSRGELKQI